MPIDSTVSIQPRSVLGLKYLDLHKGTSSAHSSPTAATLPDGADERPGPVRRRVQDVRTPTRGRRGPDRTWSGSATRSPRADRRSTTRSRACRRCSGTCAPVAQYLSDPSTELTRFFGDLNGSWARSRRWPRSTQSCSGRWRRPSGRSTATRPTSRRRSAESPSTEQVSTQSLIAQQPLLTDLTTFGQQHGAGHDSRSRRRCRYSTRRSSRAPRCSAARRALNASLQQTMDALKTLAQAPGTNIALNALVEHGRRRSTRWSATSARTRPYATTGTTGGPTSPSIFSEPTEFGIAQRALLMQSQLGAAQQRRQTRARPRRSTAAASIRPWAATSTCTAQAYGAAVDDQGNADCETGQRGYPLRSSTSSIRRDATLTPTPHTPGDQGPTFAGQCPRPHW